MDNVTVIRIVAGIVGVLIVFVLINRRRTKLK
jgi:hypothetical protein